MNRADEIAGNLAAVRERIAAACRDAGRTPAELTLVAVTKTWPADDLRRLAALGVTDVGENKDQEARAKHEACADLGLRWHFVGQLQRNKCRSVAGYADVVHSVDRMSLVAALSAASEAAGRSVPLTALVQVSLDAQPAGRGGVAPDLVLELAEAVAAAPGLELGGVMGVAPLGTDPDQAFRRLSVVAVDVRSRHPAATVVSAGMTGDLEAAVRHGATHLRIGTALLGHRGVAVG